MRIRPRVLFVASFAAAVVCAQDDAAKEQEKFQGTWTFISVEVNGKSLNDLFKDAKAVVKADRVTVTFAKGGKFTRVFKLFTDAMPRCVDFRPEGGKGEGSEGIYELKDGRLKLLVNINDGGKERPTSFADKNKQGHIYYVVEKAK